MPYGKDERKTKGARHSKTSQWIHPGFTVRHKAIVLNTKKKGADDSKSCWFVVDADGNYGFHTCSTQFNPVQTGNIGENIDAITMHTSDLVGG